MVRLEVFECALKIPSHVQNHRDVFNHHRALLHAGAASRAGPELFLGDVAVQQPLARDFFAILTDAADDQRSQFLGPLANVHDDLAGAQNFSRDVCGTDGCAAPAVRAGKPVQQLLPGQIADVGRAKLFRVLVLEVQFSQPAGRLEGREKNVWYGCDDVQMLGKGEVIQKSQNGQKVRPPENLKPCAHRRGADEKAREPARHKSSAAHLARQRRLSCIGPEHGDHDQQNEAEDQAGVQAHVRADFRAKVPFRGNKDPARQRCQNRKHNQSADGFLE